MKIQETIIREKIYNIEYDYDEIFKQYFNQILIFSNKYLNDLEESKEITQDVFIELWERKSYLDTTNIRAYLYTSAKNKSINQIKRRITARKYLDKKLEIKDELNLYCLQSDSIRCIYNKELKIKIQESIDSLPPRCKEVFLLHRNYNLKYREISERLNISIKTVENHMIKANKILKQSINEYVEITSILLSLPLFF